MKIFFLIVGISLLFMIMPLLYRVIMGPTVIDRIVAANVIGTKTAVMLVVIGMIFERVEMFVDFALAYALLNFMGSLAAARFIHQTREKSLPIHPPQPQKKQA